MKVSQVIKSIKVNSKAWSLVTQDDTRIIMTNGEGYYFVRYCHFKGFKLFSPSNQIEMNYEENDVVAQQLWGYLVNVLLGL
jgi:hypothetical protein